MKTDEELRKTFKMSLDEKGIINLVVFVMEKDPEDSAHVMELIKDDFLKIFSENPDKKFRVLADMSPIGAISRYGFSSQVRKIGAQLMSNEQIEKGALITSSIFVKTVIDFIVTLVRKRDSIKIFLNKEDAISWLKE